MIQFTDQKIMIRNGKKREVRHQAIVRKHGSKSPK